MPVKSPLLIAALLLAACSGGMTPPENPFGPDSVPPPAASGTAAEGAAPAAIRPPSGARTAESFDTTTAAQRAEAAAPPEAPGARVLGETVASLGDPSRPGFWLETPLVDAPVMGRVQHGASGSSARVELLPIDAPVGAGSRISLAAMRLLGVPLTDLPTLEVMTGG